MNFSAVYFQEKELSAALAVVVHVLLFTLLFFGVQWQTKHPDAIEVQLWSQLPDVATPVAPQVEPKIEPKIEPRPEIKKPDIALKEKAEKEKIEKNRAEQEKREKDRKEQLKQMATQEERQLKSQRQADEMKRMAQTELSSGRARINNDYYGKIIGKIRGNLVMPPDLPGNPEAVFDIVQLPSGEVISTRLKKSSGFKPYDDAVERAILRSSPLPTPEKADLFVRSLELKFRPKD